MPAYIVAPVGGVALALKVRSWAPLVLAAFIPPSVHWGYGQIGKGALALVAQPVAMIVGAGLVYPAARAAASPGSHSAGPLLILIGGAALGYLAWAIVDVRALAYRDVPDRQTSIVPMLAPASGGGFVGGVGGLF